MKLALAALVAVGLAVALAARIFRPKIVDLGRYGAESVARGNLGLARMALEKLDPKPADPRGKVIFKPLWDEYRWARIVPHGPSDAIEIYPKRAAADTGGYGYAAGEIWINCTHTDSKGSTWAAY